jgi:HSP20 family protein
MGGLGGSKPYSVSVTLCVAGEIALSCILSFAYGIIHRIGSISWVRDRSKSMAGKQHGRGDKPGHRFSETGHFLTSVASSQWVLSRHGQVWRPPTDVYETDSNIVVKVEVAGMAEDDFSITFVERSLAVAGIRRDPSAKLGYHQMEIPYGEFHTEVYVPEAIDVDGIEASYTNGFLIVTLPKASVRRVVISQE